MLPLEAGLNNFETMLISPKNNLFLDLDFTVRSSYSDVVIVRINLIIAEIREGGYTFKLYAVTIS